MNSSTQNKIIVFIENIRTALDRFVKPYDWFYNIKNNQHIKVSVRKVRNSSIDEYYAAAFLKENKDYVIGDCLVIKPLHFKLSVNQKKVTYISFNKNNYTVFKKNLKKIKSGSMDTIIIPYVLNNCLNYAEVVKECYRIVRPGGIVLACVSTISSAVKGNLWGFTASALQYVFKTFFNFNELATRSYGNALVGRFFLEKKEAADLTRDELNYSDLYFPVVVAIRAKK